MQNILNEEQLEQLYNWVDEIPLSRPKRNMARDFSDAVLMAQIIAHFHPQAVQLHNFIATGSIKQKVINWNTLNNKVLKKLKISLKKQEIDQLAAAEPQLAQRLILLVKKAIQNSDLISPSIVSKSSTKFSFMSKLTDDKKKPLTWKQIQKRPDVKQIIENKNSQVTEMKKIIEMLMYKHQKLEEILKSKDKQIEELVKTIKEKGVI